MAGVGDPAFGEWREWTGKAFHIRRRLTGAEWAHVGPALDIRRTPEARQRVLAVGKYLIFAPSEVLADEAGVSNPFAPEGDQP